MEYARDLGQVDLWEESLRRSLERRGKTRRSSVELHQLRPTRDLTLEVSEDSTLDPILAIQTFYVLAARLAKARGLNPDEPPHLSKVTLTRPC